MADLFSSTTADPKYSLFVGPREAALWNNYNVEIMEMVAKQDFIYWSVERDMSETDDLYGESTKKVGRNPVQTYGLIQLDEPETITNNFTTEVRTMIQMATRR